MKTSHRPETLRIYKAEAVAFIMWLQGKFPDIKFSTSLDNIILEYFKSHPSKRMTQRRAALQFGSHRDRNVVVTHREIRGDSARLSALVKLAGLKGIPKAVFR